MVNISKNKLSDETREKIYAQFMKTILSLSDTNAGREYINNLLTDSEKIMLAKRLAVMMMLEKKYSWNEIMNVLKVSRATVFSVKKKLGHKKSASILNHSILSDIDQNKFWSTVEVILRGGMPEYGKGRWKGLNKLNAKYNKK